VEWASDDGVGIDWSEGSVPKWGTVALNLLVEIRGPGDWADHLHPYNGTGVWECQNHQANLTQRLGEFRGAARRYGRGRRSRAHTRLDVAQDREPAERFTAETLASRQRPGLREGSARRARAW
jgi:hypothetical protein